MSSRICVRICAIWLSLTVAAVAQTPLTSVPPIARAAASLPALPQVFLDTTYIPPAGPTITVPAGGDFQAALNNAQPGSTITLQAGATYTGPFTLPAKAGAGWIYIISSAMASLPAPGNRVGPANAPQMAKIVVTPGGGPAIGAADGAGYYRFVGIEITPASDGWVEALVNFGSNATTLAQLPTHIVFDRSYIHGAPTAGGRYGVMLNVIWGAVIDSYVSGFFCTTAQGGNGIESRAVTSWNGVGPFKIENDYLEASTEVIMFGGWGPLIPNLVPSDIEVRGNHFNKLLAWQGTMWVKNLFELKNAQRVLVDGNIFEHNWVGGDQHGAAVLFTVRNQQGIAPWSIVADVTFTHNIVQHSTGAVEMLGQDYVYPSQQLQRVLVQNNLFVDIGAYPGSDRTGRLFQMTSGSANVVIDHNTAFQTENPLVAAEATTTVLTSTGFVFTNTIANNGPYGISGDGSYGNPTLTLSTYFPGAVCLDNAMPGPSPYSPPPGNFFPANLQAVGFVNYAGGDYHLAASSPYKNAGTDGKDIGADIDALNAATATALSGGGSSVSLSPILSVAPTTVSFGSVTVGGSADSSLTVKNAGGGILTGTTSTAAPFSVVSGGAFSLSGGASQTVVVRFSPTAASTVTGSVTVNSNGGTASVAVTGTGAATPASVLSVTPSTVSFGSVTVGGSADSSLTVTNTGGGVLTGTASTAAPFSVVSGGAFSLSGGVSQTVVVRFSPTAASTITGSVTVNSDGGTASVAVTGTGAATPAPVLSVTPTTASFGSVAVGASMDSSLTVTNTGGGILTGTVSTAAPFSVVSGGAFALSGGASETVVVQFSPTAAGTVTGSVTSTSSGGSASVAVTGTGTVAPVVSVTPAAVSFGSVAVGASMDSSLTVTNTGGGTLTGATSTVAPFSVVSGGAFSLAGGASQTVVVRFSPTAATAFTGSVTVTSNGGAGAVAVTGTGTTTAIATATAPSPGTAAQAVVWTRAVNVTVSGNSLQKTGGCDGCQDAGAVSSQALISGNGYVEFTVANTATQYVVSVGNANDPAFMGNWALHLNGAGRAEVREGSYTYEADTPVAVGDILRIAVVNGTVQYTKNGVVFYTSATAPIYPLQAKASLWNLGAAVSNAMTSGYLFGPLPVVWTRAVNVTVSGNSLQKTGGCDGCQDAGAVSSQALISGNGYVEFTVANTATQYVVSVGNANDPAFMGNWALHLNGAGRAEVREGSYTYEADTPVAVGDILRIAVVNGTVQYTKNGVVFYTSATAPIYPLQAKASLWNLGATVSNAMFSGSLSGSIPSPAKVSAYASGTTAQDGGSASLGESDSVGRRARGGALLLRA